MENELTGAEIKKKGNPNPASRKGKPNKVTLALKEAILKSFEMVGAEDYLAEQAMLNPGPYMALIGKIIPKEVSTSIQVVDKATMLKELAESLPK